jgi:hypothetical protein
MVQGARVISWALGGCIRQCPQRLVVKPTGGVKRRGPFLVRANPVVKVKPHPVLVAVLRRKDAVDLFRNGEILNNYIESNFYNKYCLIYLPYVISDSRFTRPFVPVGYRSSSAMAEVRTSEDPTRGPTVETNSTSQSKRTK